MRSATHCPLLLACLVARWITGLAILLRAVLLYPFLAAQIPGHGGEAAGQGQAFRYCLIVLVFINDVPARTCSCIVLGLDLGEQTLNAKGAGLHGCWVLSRAAFVLSRATRPAISSMRASSCSSFCVSRHARMMPKPLQMRAPIWLSRVPSAIARIVFAKALCDLIQITQRA